MAQPTISVEASDVCNCNIYINKNMNEYTYIYIHIYIYIYLNNYLSLYIYFSCFPISFEHLDRTADLDTGLDNWVGHTGRAPGMVARVWLMSPKT